MSEAGSYLEKLRSDNQVRQYQVKALDWMEIAEDDVRCMNSAERQFAATMSLMYCALAQDARVSAPQHTSYGNINVGKRDAVQRS